MNERRDKINYYLDIAETVAERSTCLRRRYGAIIVKNDEIISTGYNGAPRGRKNCIDLGRCIREEMNVACRNGKTDELMPGTSSCTMCRRQIINAGIEKVVIRDTRDAYRIVDVEEWIKEDDSLAE